MSAKILLVDDDPNLLKALARHYRKRFDLLIACGGKEALNSLGKEDAAVAVAVVDMRMPEMDGLQLLRSIKEISPDTVRIMLTGNADQQTAVDAINQGSLFRFFSKPCDPEILAQGIEAGIAQFKLITAERDLLEQTLAGSVKVLLDILSIVDPVSFGRSDKIREWALVVARHLKLKQRWKLNMAAMLSPLGNIMVPSEIMQKKLNGAELNEGECKVIAGVPEMTRDLIANIPRLKVVADIVYLQNKGFDGSGSPRNGPCGVDIPLEARILKILIDLEERVHGPYPTADAFMSLAACGSEYDATLLKDIRTCLEAEKDSDDRQNTEEVEIPLNQLIAGYILQGDLELENDRLILGAGIRLSQAHIQKIRVFAEIHKFKEPVKVLRNCQ